MRLDRWSEVVISSTRALSIDDVQFEHDPTPATAPHPDVKTTGALESHFIRIHTGIHEFFFGHRFVRRLPAPSK